MPACSTWTSGSTCLQCACVFSDILPYVPSPLSTGIHCTSLCWHCHAVRALLGIQCLRWGGIAHYDDISAITASRLAWCLRLASTGRSYTAQWYGHPPGFFTHAALEPPRLLLSSRSRFLLALCRTSLRHMVTSVLCRRLVITKNHPVGRTNVGANSPAASHRPVAAPCSAALHKWLLVHHHHTSTTSTALYEVNPKVAGTFCIITTRAQRHVSSHHISYTHVLVSADFPTKGIRKHFCKVPCTPQPGHIAPA